MPCPHFDIAVIQRSEGQSAVAAAAYQSGEKLYSQYDRETKSYESKGGRHAHRNHAATQRSP